MAPATQHDPRCGHMEVVDFLLKRGVAFRERHRGETGLHHAAVGGRLEMVKLLLARGAPVDVKDERWNGTPLGWALYNWHQSSSRSDDHYAIVAALVAAGAPVPPEWLTEDWLTSDPRMLAAVSGTLSR